MLGQTEHPKGICTASTIQSVPIAYVLRVVMRTELRFWPGETGVKLSTLIMTFPAWFTSASCCENASDSVSQFTS
ncbi:unnamed protein product, partial [Mycena citricolor]